MSLPQRGVGLSSSLSFIMDRAKLQVSASENIFLPPEIPMGTTGDADTELSHTTLARL